jgi:2-polyprenyl-3-methyl-5-hydroxy-6-metoxy-1,4-benzoquinol methylase
MSEQKLCPICKSPRLYHSKDEAYIRCKLCNVLRTGQSYCEGLYGQSYARTYLKYAETDINTPLQLFRLGLVSRWLKAKDKIFDVGCCIGEFIRFAEDYYNCCGYEPNSIAASLAADRVHSTIYHGFSNSIPKSNCVTLFDVLEHLEFPQTFLALLRDKYMLPSSVLVITTPNVDVIPTTDDAALRRWKHYKPNEHLFLYTESSLEIMLSQLGFRTIHWGREESDIRPGNPDGDIMTCVARRL